MKEIFKLRTTKLIGFCLILILNSILFVKINYLRRTINDAIGDYYEFRDVFKNYISPTISLIEIISIIIFAIIIILYLRFVLYSSKLNK
ncbi:hypothetical protein [Clostridium sardiniense]|uniref:hypothetical protein n=1 Tax=Clostridium sardiniense TaxID=29369 RepID=UPI003D351B7C